MPDSDRLQSSLRLPCGTVLPNRLAKAAMTERIARSDHNPNELHIALYRRWAGNAGLLISGNIMVDRRSLESAGNVVVEDDRALEAMQKWTAAAKEGGSLFFAQISHSGRQTSRFVNPRPVSASNVALSDRILFARPRPLEEREIEDLLGRFARTAEVCKKGGFDGIQIHAAHGYLLSQFLSPLTNLRTDRWGGSLENRARLLIGVVRAVRQAVGKKFPISVKLNSADFQKGGFSEEDSLSVIHLLEAEHIDLLEISGGSYENPSFFNEPVRESTRRREAYFLAFAERVRKISRLKLMITGGFRTRAFALAALDNKSVDVIGTARPHLVDPGFGRRFLSGELASIQARSPRGSIPRINLMAEGGFWDLQIDRIAHGLQPDIRAGLARSVAHILMREIPKAIAHQWVG